MAKEKKDKNALNMKRIGSIANNISDMMGSIYKSTYGTSRNTTKELETITGDIDKRIDSIISRNDNLNTSNVSRLLSKTRLQSEVNNDQLFDQIQYMFSDQGLSNSILTSYIGNKYIRDLNNEIDTVCRYMPKLEEALSAKKDAVLSSDNYSKDYLNATILTSSEDERESFSSRFEFLKEKYDLADKFDLYYSNGAKYGEEFVYHVPYDRAFRELLKRKSSTKGPLASMSGIGESVLIENGVFSNVNIARQTCGASGLNTGDNKCNITLEFNFSGVLESCINEHTNLIEQSKMISENTISLNEKNDIVSNDSTKKYKFDTTIGDELEYPKEANPRDGLININDKNNKSIDKVKAPGCVIKRLSQENVIPIYIDDICMGFYYLEFLNDENGYDLYSNMMDNYNNMKYTTPSSKATNDTVQNSQYSKVLNYLSACIADRIDSSFINSNQDLAKEIYAILKYNDVYNATGDQKIRVSFLSESDVTHIKFNEDMDTHRGRSDLIKALIPAKLYSCLYITNTLGTLTRGQDKRVYYVKQNIETNTSQTLLNVINQIKKSNFGIRQIENMNSILNITGRFNDYFIPVGQSGDAPIQFEIMPGQEFNTNQDLMDSLENMTINSTDVPMELINSRYSTDFAVQITMSNVKFLRHVYNRQSKCEKFFSKILTCIYNAEYNTNTKVICTLPAPIFLNMSNINTILENTKNTVQAIAEYEYTNEEDKDKELFIRYMMRDKLGTYVKQSEVNKAKMQVQFELSKKKSEGNEEDNM